MAGNRFTRLLFWTILFVPFADLAAACEYLVRDFAFRARRDVHRLCVMARSGDKSADQIVASLSAWIDGEGSDLNLKLVCVDADDQNVDWAEYGIPSAPPVLPVVVLVGRNYGTGENFVVDHWEPAPQVEDLEALKTSPVRKQLQQELGRRLAVVLYSPGWGNGEGATQKVLDEFTRNWPASKSLGIIVIRLDRSDPSERCLLSFAGVPPPEGPDWVGVVFGRGKLMAPPLVGEAITVQRLQEQIAQLDQDCSCSKPLPSLGVDVPLVWNDRLDAAVVPLASPLELVEQKPAVLALPSLGGTVEASENAAVPVVSLTETEITGPPPSRSLLLTGLLLAVGAIVVVVAVGSVMMLRRQRV